MPNVIAQNGTMILPGTARSLNGPWLTSPPYGRKNTTGDGNVCEFNQAPSSPTVFVGPNTTLQFASLITDDHLNGAKVTLLTDPYDTVAANARIKIDFSGCPVATVNQSVIGALAYGLQYRYSTAPPQGTGLVSHNIQLTFATFDIAAACNTLAFATAELIPGSNVVLLSWGGIFAKVRIMRINNAHPNDPSFDTLVVDNYVGFAYSDFISGGAPIPNYRLYAICTQSLTDYVSVQFTVQTRSAIQNGKFRNAPSLRR